MEYAICGGTIWELIGESIVRMSDDGMDSYMALSVTLLSPRKGEACVPCSHP
jgi:hypothetical protein